MLSLLHNTVISRLTQITCNVKRFHTIVNFNLHAHVYNIMHNQRISSTKPRLMDDLKESLSNR